ncbi:hypothetical protein AK812_SmicGene27264 [Symbiodinium microadriaticum]|uniref:Uncharacterized protein n=1 Tax=Symbiodinium microadriaticum TaxID=2951 RepID=A0A1Q9D7E8_SYMMI|nr:hypothetical protein AK812_SmicGene27264 [Symbiodinium microadriaticum]
MAAASTVAAQMVQLSELFNAAGAGDSIKQTSCTTMIIAPFIAGVSIDGADHKAEAGQAPTAPPPQPAAAAAAPTVPGQPAAGSTTAAHIPDRPPKTFAAWTQQVTAFEDRLLDGKRRTFPVQELLGAEEVLARMWFEHTVTKMYTPVTLGEIVCRRTWTPGRVLNPLAAGRIQSASPGTRRSGVLANVGEFFHHLVLQVKGLLSTIDGANAARWAWILLGIGEEDDVMKYVDWVVAKTRAHADMVPAGVLAQDGVDHRHGAPEQHFLRRGGNRRKRPRPGKPKGKGGDGKDQDPPKKTAPRTSRTSRSWWWTRGGGKQQQTQNWWGNGRAPRAVTDLGNGRAPLGTARGLGGGHRPRRGTRPNAEEDSTVCSSTRRRGGHSAIGFRRSGGCAVAGLGSHQRASSSSPRRRRADRDGHAGNRGYLFNFTAEFLDELRRRLPPRRFGFLVENVEMTPADAAEASKQLGCQPVFADAADFGWIGRPRLWWSSIDWDEVTHDPSTAERWTWVLRIIAAGIAYAWTPPRAAPDSFDLDGLKFFDAVASGRIRLPCSTTPAADERGRPPPRSMRGKVTTDVQFAPWHYQRDAMLADDQEKLVVLTPGPRTRHRLLGDRWHWGVARRLLLALLVHTAASLPQATALQRRHRHRRFNGSPHYGSRPARSWDQHRRNRRWQRSRTSTRRRAGRLLGRCDTHWRRRRRWNRHGNSYTGAAAPLAARPGSRTTEVIAEVHMLIDDLDDDTPGPGWRHDSWVRATYSTPDKPAPTQVLAFLELLRRLNYPDLTALTEDMTNPVPIADLIATNAEYVRRKVHTARVDEHSEKLLLELIAEKRLGRVIGPTRPPEWLHSVRATAVADHQDVDTINEPPPGDTLLAASFPVCQTDENGELKVRRAEDWRRSGHNSTVTIADVPTHRFVGSFVDLARRMAQERRRLVVFGHDLLNAYRQWPVRRPSHCGTFLATKHGVTFWFHMAMNFGATASVWNFNRAADALQQLLRGLLLTPTGHYVDDFNGVEDEELGASAADGFQAQPLAAEHIVQGVTFHIDEHGVTLSPTPQRVEKILAQIQLALDDDSLSPDDASKLAGRVAFLTQAVFGAVARAATKAIYARAADTAAWSNDSLSPGLAAALRTLVSILPTTKPRFVPFDAADLDMAVLYADAFFTMANADTRIVCVNGTTRFVTALSIEEKVVSLAEMFYSKLCKEHLGMIRQTGALVPTYSMRHRCTRERVLWASELNGRYFTYGLVRSALEHLMHVHTDVQIPTDTPGFCVDHWLSTTAERLTELLKRARRSTASSPTLACSTASSPSLAMDDMETQVCWEEPLDPAEDVRPSKRLRLRAKTPSYVCVPDVPDEDGRDVDWEAIHRQCVGRDRADPEPEEAEDYVSRASSAQWLDADGIWHKSPCPWDEEDHDDGDQEEVANEASDEDAEWPEASQQWPDEEAEWPQETEATEAEANWAEWPEDDEQAVWPEQIVWFPKGSDDQEWPEDDEQAVWPEQIDWFPEGSDDQEWPEDEQTVSPEQIVISGSSDDQEWPEEDEQAWFPEGSSDDQQWPEDDKQAVSPEQIVWFPEGSDDQEWPEEDNEQTEWYEAADGEAISVPDSDEQAGAMDDGQAGWQEGIDEEQIVWFPETEETEWPAEEAIPEEPEVWFPAGDDEQEAADHDDQEPDEDHQEWPAKDPPAEGHGAADWPIWPTTGPSVEMDEERLKTFWAKYKTKANNKEKKTPDDVWPRILEATMRAPADRKRECQGNLGMTEHVLSAYQPRLPPMTFSERQNRWNHSDERKDVLSNMDLNEQKRRAHLLYSAAVHYGLKAHAVDVAYSSKMDILTAFGFLVFLTSESRVFEAATIECQRNQLRRIQSFVKMVAGLLDNHFKTMKPKPVVDELEMQLFDDSDDDSSDSGLENLVGNSSQ